MSQTDFFSQADVQATFQASLKQNEKTIVDGVVPLRCAVVGELYFQMCFQNKALVAREEVPPLALIALDEHQKKTKLQASPKKADNSKHISN